VEPHALGTRDLGDSVSTRTAAHAAGVHTANVDLAELHAPFTHQSIILERALGLGADVTINPSGGALAANAMMVARLTRLGEAATRLSNGDGKRAVAHATSGPCLQQNLVCVLEVE
jgi:acetyl-CoA acetyltransferase